MFIYGKYQDVVEQGLIYGATLSAGGDWFEKPDYDDAVWEAMDTLTDAQKEFLGVENSSDYNDLLSSTDEVDIDKLLYIEQNPDDEDPSTNYGITWVSGYSIDDVVEYLSSDSETSLMDSLGNRWDKEGLETLMSVLGLDTSNVDDWINFKDLVDDFTEKNEYTQIAGQETN